MTEATELKPCPFCGCVEHLVNSPCGSMTSDMPSRPHRVVCFHLDCEGVQGPVGYGKYQSAIAWNTRALTPSAVATEVEVTQADRDEAAKMQRWRNGDKPSEAEDALRDGLLDDNYTVQAFARHRVRALTQAGEPVAWMYTHPNQPSYGPNLDRMLKVKRQILDNHGWTEIPLYTYAPTERERALLEALKEVQVWASTERRWSETGDLQTWVNRCDKINAAIARAQEPK